MINRQYLLYLEAQQGRHHELQNELILIQEEIAKHRELEQKQRERVNKVANILKEGGESVDKILFEYIKEDKDTVTRSPRLWASLRITIIQVYLLGYKEAFEIVTEAETEELEDQSDVTLADEGVEFLKPGEVLQHKDYPAVLNQKARARLAQEALSGVTQNKHGSWQARIAVQTQNRVQTVTVGTDPRMEEANIAALAGRRVAGKLEARIAVIQHEAQKKVDAANKRADTVIAEYTNDSAPF